jgi:tellurite resistance protein
MAASLFGVAVGILGLAGAWNVAARIWGLPPQIGRALELLGAVVWLALLGLYARKWYCDRSAALAELRDPFQSSFVSLAFISAILVSMSALEVSRRAGVALFTVAVVGQLALGVWLLGRVWQGGQRDDFVTPALYLPAVGQNFVAASGASACGWPEVASWLFGCGALSWLATESIVLARAASRETLPAPMRPAMGVQLAPPVVGGLAYLGLTTGPPDLLAHMLFGYGLYQALLMVQLAPWIRQPSFTASYWSFSFGATALPTMAMRMLERRDATSLSWIAVILFAGANLFIAYLALGTVSLWVKGRPLPVPAAPAR